MSESAEGVEDSGVTGTGERALTVGREGVGGDTLGSRAAWNDSRSATPLSAG